MVTFKQHGNHINVSDINVLVCEFWNTPIQPGYLASPTGCPGDNWGHIVKEAAEDLQYFFSQPRLDGPIRYHFSIKDNIAEFEMDHVARMILFRAANYRDDAAEMYDMINWMKPYIELCFHLKSLGITVRASW